MGDYTKLIVHAEVKVPRDELDNKVAELSLYESAYHCDGVVISIEKAGYPDGSIAITLVGQTKWGGGQKEFLDWLSPYVIQGSGPCGAWAIQFDEYSCTPVIRSLREEEASV